MFSEVAPKHWAAGLPVIPLKPREKMPWLNAWQTYGLKMPEVEEQNRWLGDFAEGNIGLPLGPCSGLVALDLDSEDPRVARILDQMLPYTPWTRVGQKGSVRIFRYTEERTTRIKGENGDVICEILARGTQIVLPPSIHPKTQMSYTANCELVDVLDRIVPLPRDFETHLRQALIDGGIKLSSRGSVQVTKWVPAGGRDSALVAMAGLLARGVLKGERTLMEACNEAAAWVVGFTENVAGDPMDPSKASEKVMEFVRRDVLEHARVLPTGWDHGLGDQEKIEAKKYFGEEVEEWTVEEYLTHLTDQFAEIPRDNQASRATVVDLVLGKLAKSQHMGDLQKEIILQFIYNGNSRLLSMASMRKRIKELSGTGIEGFDHTQVAKHLMAEIERYGEVRFESGHFYQWAGSHWRQMSDTDILKVLAEEFGHLQAARKHSDHKGILQVASNLVPRGLKTWDVPGINFANGYLTLDMELKEHDPSFGARYVMPYRYVPNEGAPLRLLGFLDQCWGEDEDYADKVQAFRQALASTMFGLAPKYSRAICLFGPAKTGKSTLKNVVQGLVPDDVLCSVPPQDWGDRFLPTAMMGKLLNFCGELSEKDLIAGDKFKMIVEGEELNGQLKGGQIFRFRPLCAHWFASNHLPRTRDTSAGFNRRWLFLHFTSIVRDGQKIVDLDKLIVSEEREAIAAWAVSAVVDLMRQQEYTLPASHKYLISEVAATNNSVAHFLMSGGVLVHGLPGNVDCSVRTSEKALYTQYYAFCKVVANAMPVQLKRFRLILQELTSEQAFEFKIERSTDGSEEPWYYGITIATKKEQT